jgi:hypothetical protein
VQVEVMELVEVLQDHQVQLFQVDQAVQGVEVELVVIVVRLLIQEEQVILRQSVQHKELMVGQVLQEEIIMAVEGVVLQLQEQMELLQEVVVEQERLQIFQVHQSLMQEEVEVEIVHLLRHQEELVVEQMVK